MFSKPAYQCPELLLLALAAVTNEAGGSLRVEMLSRLLPLYFRPNRNKHAAALIRRLWKVNARLVVQSGVKAFNVDSTLPSVVYVSGGDGCGGGGDNDVGWGVVGMLPAFTLFGPRIATKHTISAWRGCGGIRVSSGCCSLAGNSTRIMSYRGR